ncbi:MAG: VCBS repeat-containing protein [Verrucomicrobia bacterium]|nr:VCBS repeat-containing protein [Deltaproteobacteria bacterium]
MPTILLALITAFLLIASPCVSQAAPITTFVAEFNVVGAPNRDELKVTLQGLLASRLNPDQVQLVEKPDQAEVLLAGSYALFGKVFSIDVLLKNSLNGTMAKVFEQGESQDDLIPAFGRLAQKLEREFAKARHAAVTPSMPASSPVPAPPVAAKITAPVTAYKIEAPVAGVEERYVVKSGMPDRNTPGSWTSDPLSGVFTSIALGRSLPSGEREIFVAAEHSVRYLRKGTELKQVVEIAVPVPAKILAIDSADLDRDGTPEIYVTIIDRKTVSSRVYQPSGSGMELIADNQPWLYRGIGQDFKERTIFVQGLNSSGEYFNGVAELVKSGQRFETRNSRTLPRPGNIFNFTRFRDASGADKWVITDEDGYLSIHAADGSKLWKSSDKYGGSETYFNYESVAQLRAKGDKYRWNFLEQRIMALPDGTLIIPRNEGSFSIGNNRSYNKHSLFGLQWSGSLLREAWHTRQTPSYLADYAYDPATREVVLLEVVQGAGLFGTGKTAISINKLD